MGENHRKMIQMIEQEEKGHCTIIDICHSREWWQIPLVAALTRQRQEDLSSRSTWTIFKYMPYIKESTEKSKQSK